MSIETIVTYRVSVIIPDAFCEQFGNTEEYDKACVLFSGGILSLYRNAKRRTTCKHSLK